MKISYFKSVMLFFIVDLINGLTMMSNNKLSIKQINDGDGESIPFIEPKITYDNNPSLDHVLIENHRFNTNKQANPIPKIYKPEETTYQETENYVVRLFKTKTY